MVRGQNGCREQYEMLVKFSWNPSGQQTKCLLACRLTNGLNLDASDDFNYRVACQSPPASCRLRCRRDACAPGKDQAMPCGSSLGASPALGPYDSGFIHPEQARPRSAPTRAWASAIIGAWIWPWPRSRARSWIRRFHLRSGRRRCDVVYLARLIRLRLRFRPRIGSWRIVRSRARTGWSRPGPGTGWARSRFRPGIR